MAVSLPDPASVMIAAIAPVTIGALNEVPDTLAA